MRLVKDTNIGAWAVQVPCVSTLHRHPRGLKTNMFTLAEGYADLDGQAFVSYYCDTCVAKDRLQEFIVS